MLTSALIKLCRWVFCENVRYTTIGIQHNSRVVLICWNTSGMTRFCVKHGRWIRKSLSLLYNEYIHEQCTWLSNCHRSIQWGHDYQFLMQLITIVTGSFCSVCANNKYTKKDTKKKLSVQRKKPDCSYIKRDPIHWLYWL